MSIANKSHHNRNTQCSRMLKGRQTTVYLWRCTKIQPSNPWTHRNPPRARRHPDHHSQTPNQAVKVRGLQWRNPRHKSIQGTGFLIKESLNPRFKRISYRTSTAKIQLNGNHYVTIIVAYASTLRKSEQNARMREEFYDQINSLTS